MENRFTLFLELLDWANDIRIDAATSCACR
jgi:hypothetical protein